MGLMQQLFRKKLPKDIEAHGLAKCLGPWDLAFMGIGAIIGTGIFVLTGIAAATQAGPAVIVSFVVAGIACAFAALCYAELAASVGGCGSAYGYSYAAFGELIAWIIGWDLILEYGVSVAAVANGWSGYFKDALAAMGFGLPACLTKGPDFAWMLNGDRIVWSQDTAMTILNNMSAYKVVNVGGIANIPAVAIILILMALLIAGVKQSARLNAGMVFIKLLAITIFIGVAAFHVHPANWTPFAPFGWFSKLPDGQSVGILAGASLVFFAYVGFDAVSTAVEESHDPQKDAPFGILAALIFCTIIYIIVSGLLTLIVPYTELNVSSPVAHALELIGVNWASALVSTGVIAGLTTVMLVLYYGLTRIVLSMSTDGLLPKVFSAVSATTHTPVKNTVVCGIIMAIMAGVTPLGILAELVNIGTLAAFVLVCAGVIVLRITKPDMPRPFKMPFGFVLPVLGVLSCGALIAFVNETAQIRFIVWLAVGMVIYFFYSKKHSRFNA